MLDIKLITAQAEALKDNIAKRGINADVDALLLIYSQRKALMLELEQQRSSANRLAKNIIHADSIAKLAQIDAGRNLNQQISMLEAKLKELDELYQESMLSMPNFMATDTPLGSDDNQNIILKSHLSPPVFDFIPLDHVELGRRLQLIDFESGTKVAGSKFYFLKNEAVLLELALKLFAMKIATSFGYTPLITPDLAKKSVVIGAGFNPRGDESNIYNLEGLDLNLIATAEITTGGIHAGEILDETMLPLKYVAESHCFRREAGGGGQENKGLYRVHQFSKIELFQITTPEDSENALAEILNIEETIYQQLGLAYRVMRICAGDLGAPAFKKYDIEVWMPGRESIQKYGEVTSASNCTDFQARRLNIKYRTKDHIKIYPHTLNGTAIALSRTLLAIMENYQQKDGSIIIPEVLRPYIGMETIKR